MSKITTQRIISFILSFIMIPGLFSAVSLTVAAADSAIPANAIHIKTAAELEKIGSEQSAGKYYVLDNDINLTAEWVPIYGFAGMFDGQGHSINNLFILASSAQPHAGLFGTIIKDYVTIKNVGVNIGEQGVNAYDSSAGGLACAGGVVGSNGGKITNCYTTGNVTSYHSSDLTFYYNFPGSDYSDGSIIIAYDCAGGLVGRNGGTIINCYAMGNVTAHDSAGGLVGDTTNTTINNCYRLKTQTVTGSKINESGTPLSESDMRLQSSFTGWDFTTVWAIDLSINGGYPHLRSGEEKNSATQVWDSIFSIIREILQGKK